MFQPALCKYTSSCEVSEKLWQLLRCKNKVLRRGGDETNASHQPGGNVGMAPQGCQEISETLIYWNTSSKPETSTNHQLWGPWNLRDTKMGWFEARKNIHNGSLPKTLRAVTALFRKLSPDSALHPPFWTSQRLDNPNHTEFLHQIGRFGNIFIWYSFGQQRADSLTVKENCNRYQPSELLRKP